MNHLSTPVNDNTPIHYDMSYQLNQHQSSLNQPNQVLMRDSLGAGPTLDTYRHHQDHFQAVAYDDIQSQTYQDSVNPVYDIYTTNSYQHQAGMQNNQRVYLEEPIEQAHLPASEMQTHDQHLNHFVGHHQVIYGGGQEESQGLIFYEPIEEYNDHYQQHTAYNNSISSSNRNQIDPAAQPINQVVGQTNSLVSPRIHNQYQPKQHSSNFSYYQPNPQHVSARTYQHHHHYDNNNPQQSHQHHHQNMNCFASPSPSISSHDPRLLATDRIPPSSSEYPQQSGINRMFYQNGTEDIDLHQTMKQQQPAALSYEQPVDSIYPPEQLMITYDGSCSAIPDLDRPEIAPACEDLLTGSLPEVVEEQITLEEAERYQATGVRVEARNSHEGEPPSIASKQITSRHHTAIQRRPFDLEEENGQGLVAPKANTSSTPGQIATPMGTNENKRQKQTNSQHSDSQERDFVDLKSSTSNMPQDWLDNICHHLIDHLNRFGICVIDNFLGLAKGDSILKEVEQLYSNGRYMRGRVVNNKIVTSRSLGNGDVSVIRNDRVIWVEGSEEGCSEINNLIQTLCSVVTNSSRLSLYSNNGLDKIVINKRTKAHVACYPGNGTRYIKHVDNPNNDGRVITSIYYINKEWNTKRDGGLLRMFPAGMSEVANIEPLFDRVLFFWSDRRNPHEVLPAYKDRFAITVWYIGENRPKLE